MLTLVSATTLALLVLNEAVDQAKASTKAARRQVPILEARRAAAAAAVKADEAQVEQARLNLSYTRLLAPVDGMAGQRTMEVGNYVAPGASLMVVVPLDRIYIEANYREVALRHVLPGQRSAPMSRAARTRRRSTRTGGTASAIPGCRRWWRAWPRRT